MSEDTLPQQVNDSTDEVIAKDNLVAKMVAKRVFIGLLILLILDFALRMVFQATDGSTQVKQQTQAQSINLDAILLSEAQVNELLAWSDIKPKVVEVVKTPVAVKKAVVKKPPPVKVDVHKQVAAAISGDKSKRLVGDELLTLKGIFFDGQEFAVVEIENIVTKTKRYFRAAKGKTLGKFKLTTIGKNQVSISGSDRVIKLFMFDPAS